MIGSEISLFEEILKCYRRKIDIQLRHEPGCLSIELKKGGKRIDKQVLNAELESMINPEGVLASIISELQKGI